MASILYLLICLAMADLASNASVGPVSLTEISFRQNISLAYLEQIFIKLKKKEKCDKIIS